MGKLTPIKHGVLVYVLLNAVCHAAQAHRVANQLTCIPGALDLYGDFQTVRIECAGQVVPGSIGAADFNWGPLLAEKSHLRSTVMELDQLPDYVTEGEERVSLFGTFQRDNRDIPTCQTKRRVSLIRDKVVAVLFDPKMVFKGVDPPVGPPSIPSAPPSHKQYYDEKYDDDDEEEERFYDEDEFDDEDESQGYASYVNVQYDDWEDAEGGDAEIAAWGDETRQCRPRAAGQVVTENVDGHELAGVSAAKPQQTGKKPTKLNKVLPSTVRPQTSSKVAQQPQNLRVLVKCKSAPAGGANLGSCIIRMRLTVRFSGGLNTNLPRVGTAAVGTAAVGTAQTEDGQAANNLVRGLGFTCRTVTFRDLLNVLDTTELNGGQGPDVDTQLCFRGRDVPIAAADTTMPAGASYDEDALRKAVRFARYSSAIHGCIPGQSYGDGLTRTWQDIAEWGGSTPNPRCTSCFKDGINFGPGLGGPPFGWQTPGVTEQLNSYNDAGIVFTDLAVDPEPAIVVLFRATVGSLEGGNGFGQWVSNIGSCFLLASIQTPIPDSRGRVNEAAGNVCNGWNSGALDTLYNRLLANVRRRIDALTNAGASPRIYVIGHSRGGALAATFAARLLAERQSGRLGDYSGPFSQRGQVSLYTFGAPRAGDATFANFLEERTYERFRIVTRFDPVSYGPNENPSDGGNYKHFRPLVLYRDPDANPPLFPLLRRCVLTPQVQLSASLQRCYASCSSALICSNVDVPASVAVSGQRVPVNTACTRLLDESVNFPESLAAAPGLVDHGTYMGVDVDNGQCSENLSVYNAFRGGVACTLFG